MDPATGLDSVLTAGIAGDTVALSAGPLRGTTVLDVSGQVVTPGFIDLHAHGQTPSALWLPRPAVARGEVTTREDVEAGLDG